MIKKSAELSAKNALEAVAKKNGVSIETVRLEIEIAVAVSRNNANPNIQTFWNSMPIKGDVPTNEEVIAYIAKKVKSNIED